MRKALQFYAARDNYIDGVPMLAQLGELVDPDEGYTARRALKLDDYHSGTPVLKSTIEEGKMLTKENRS